MLTSLRQRMTEIHFHPGHIFRRPNILASLDIPTPYKATLYRYTEYDTGILISDVIGSDQLIHLEAKHNADFTPQWDLILGIVHCSLSTGNNIR